ncbi:hypothetical protein MUNTM_01330 [Mycobacterium sp. MUNTM1]
MTGCPVAGGGCSANVAGGGARRRNRMREAGPTLMRRRDTPNIGSYRRTGSGAVRDDDVGLHLASRHTFSHGVRVGFDI